MNTHAHDDHILSYKTLFAVLCGLFTLTAITVFVSTFDFGAMNVWMALFVAACKSTLVLAFFMHLKYEPPLLRRGFYATAITLAILIGLVLFDVMFR